MKWKSTRFNNIIDKKGIKRVTSAITAMAVVIACLPMTDIADGSKSLYTNVSSMGKISQQGIKFPLAYQRQDKWKAF